MSANEAMIEIESSVFAARMNLASDLWVFVRAARDERAVSDLLGHLRTRETLEEVFQRILELARTAPDVRYRHPFDTALAIYMWLVEQTDRAVAGVAAEAILGVPQTFWARQFATPIVAGSRIKTSATTQDQNWPAGRVAKASIAQDFVMDWTELSHLVLERSKFERVRLFVLPSKARAA
ncbi:MAG: hypothetical protein HY294_07530 [Candidatus Rokubacteria bacterium]|nr:hypothetical protein [Candidatus Rokubacteria bacterium]